MSAPEGVLRDLSKLSRSIAVEREEPPAPRPRAAGKDTVPSLLGEMMGRPPAARAQPPPERRGDAAALAQSARNEAAAFEEALQELAREKVELEERLGAADARIAALESAADASAGERAALSDRLADAERRAAEGEAAVRELARVKEELAKVQRAQAEKAAEADANAKAAEERFRLELEEVRAHSSSVSVLLDRPVEFTEVFAGEVREHVLAALREAYSAAESGGRERRATILEAVLAGNVSTGELERRREAVKGIVREGGRFVDDSVISALARLGFRYVSGSNHHKLVYAGVRVTLSKTPSDHRAILNNSAQICNLVY